MAAVLSENAKLYYNLTSTYGGAGTYATPDWDLISNVTDLTLGATQEKVDVTTRASGGFREYLQGMIEASVSFKMVYDTGDVAFEDIQEAFWNKTPIEIAVMDGLIATSGSEGLRAHMMVEAFDREENIGGVLMVNVQMSPVKNSNAAPAWYEVGA